MDNNILNKRTKGDYTYTLCNNNDYIDIDCNGKRITSILIDSDDDTKKSFEEISEENEANAAFIVKAVNNYDSLLEALKNCVVVMERARNILSGKDGGNWGMLDTTQANEAIQKAEQ